MSTPLMYPVIVYYDDDAVLDMGGAISMPRFWAAAGPQEHQWFDDAHEAEAWLDSRVVAKQDAKRRAAKGNRDAAEATERIRARFRAQGLL